MNLRERLRQLWEEPGAGRERGPFALLLEVFSFFYRSGVVFRNFLYDQQFARSTRLPCKVISVGNVTVGGTGKTPLVILLAGMLRKQGYRPAVLSRGYGSKGAAPVNIVSDGHSLLLGPEEGGDEPVLISGSVPGVPVLTGPDRVLTGRTAMTRLGADVLILDDGFQHRRLFRDIDILLLDADRPWGNGFLLPRGPLREPPARALKRADIVIRTGGKMWKAPGLPAGSPDRSRVIQGDLPVFRGSHQPRALISRPQGRRMELRDLAGKRICAFSGIGSPESFRGMLISLGAEIGVFLVYPDHHRYTPLDVEAIAQAAQGAGAEMIVTTDKDEVKWMALDKGKGAIPRFSLSIEMTIDPWEDFERFILKKLKEDR